MSRLLSCPMKDNLRVCAGTFDAIKECGCRTCFRWKNIFDTPYDAFLSRFWKVKA